MNDTTNFLLHLNTQAQKQIIQNTAFFLKQKERPCYILNPFTKKLFSGNNWTALQINNDEQNKDYVYYIDRNSVIARKPDWLKNREAATLEKKITNVPIIENDKIIMVSPASNYNQTELHDNPSSQKPLQHYVPFQVPPEPNSDTEQYFTTNLANYFNAAKNKLPYLPYPFDKDLIAKLIAKISIDPDFISRCSNNANDEVDNYHYIPLNRINFISNAQNSNSIESKQLLASITSHIKNICLNHKKSFNTEFNDLVKPLLAKIETVSSSEIDIVIEKEAAQFIKENMANRKNAHILVNTFLGTIVEKIKNLPEETKHIGAALIVGSIFMGYPVMQSNTEQNTIPDDTTIVFALEKQSQNLLNVNSKDAVIINNKTFKENELQQILNFDYNPIDLNDDGKITIHDYQIARQVENIIIKTKNFTDTQKQKYIEDQKMQQIKNFMIHINKKSNIANNDPNLASKINAIYGQIAISLQNNGDSFFNELQPDTRSLFSYLNYQIKKCPQLLEEALNNIFNQKKTNMIKISTDQLKDKKEL